MKNTCCVVGAGPAGMMLSYLLGRAGLSVIVLEKHEDFFRDFRGDTVHPSTLEVLRELDLLEDFLKIPHQEILTAGGVYGDFAFQGPDFSHVPAHCKFVAMMPQWDFLSFLSGKAKRFPHFDLRMGHEAIGLIWEGSQIVGVVARQSDGTTVNVRADLVIGCDGRTSIVRRSGQLDLIESGVPIDVLWFRISRKRFDPDQVLGIGNFGKALVLINRYDYFQAGLIIQKGSFEEIQRRGLDEFRQSIAQLAPNLRDRVNELEDWDQIKLLTVQINRLSRWHRPGLLCIGDAAHAMSPAGGVGINLAIQDAVAAANILTRPLQRGCISEDFLAAVQKRREFPTRFTQALQVLAHKGLARVFEQSGPLRAPWQLKAALQIPGSHRLFGYVVGIGVRPEHVHKPIAVKIGTAVGRTLAAVVLRTRSLRRQAAAGSYSATHPAPRLVPYS